MDKPQDPEAAETVQTTNVPAVDLPRLVRQSSDTPETDQATLKADDIDGGGTFDAVHVQVSKRLERERDEVRKKLSYKTQTWILAEGTIREQFQRIASLEADNAVYRDRCEKHKIVIAKVTEAIAVINGQGDAETMLKRLSEILLPNVKSAGTATSESQRGNGGER